MEPNIKEKNKKKLRLSDVLELILVWWGRTYRIVFIFSMVGSMSLGIYFWYASLYTQFMNDQEKNDYRALKDKSVDLLDEDFKEAIDSIERRELEYSSAVETKKDIFK